MPTEMFNFAKTLSPDEQIERFKSDIRYDGEIEPCSRLASYPLTLSFLKEYYKNGALIVGDTAHAIHPLAGQGLNLTIRDIQLLAIKVENALNLGLDIGSTHLFRDFTKKRLPDVMSMIALTDCLEKAFTTKVLNAFAATGMQLLDSQQWIKNAAMHAAMGTLGWE